LRKIAICKKITNREKSHIAKQPNLAHEAILMLF